MTRLIIITIIGGLAFSTWTLFHEQSLDGTHSVSIESGTAVTSIIDQLKDEGIISNPSFAKLYVALTGRDVTIQAGNYTFSGSVSLSDVITVITGGAEPKKEVTLTFIEGWTARDMAAYVAEKGVVSERDFLQAVESSYDLPLYSSVLHTRGTVEGYLFPDTYNFFADVSADEIVKKMLETFEIKLASKIRTDITLQEKTIDDIVIMASILERELRTYEEKRTGAGVLYNRLKAGIPLQVDASVNYITGKNTPRASARDIEVDSPYNTYQHRGLPPGPISNPGFESLRAAVYPDEHSYFYFLTTPEGNAIFNTTLEGHNAAKAKYY